MMLFVDEHVVASYRFNRCKGGRTIMGINETVQQDNLLPDCDGAIAISSSSKPVRFHMVWLVAHNNAVAASHEIARMACQTAILTLDSMRRRHIPAMLKGLLSSECLQRTLYFEEVVTEVRVCSSPFTPRNVFMPIEPDMVHGMVVSQRKIEISIRLHIGTYEVWGNLEFQQQRGHWICTTADLG